MYVDLLLNWKKSFLAICFAIWILFGLSNIDRDKFSKRGYA